MITILKSKLRSSNPFRYGKVTNKDRRQTVAKIARFNHVNSEFTKFLLNISGLLPFNLLKADL